MIARVALVAAGAVLLILFGTYVVGLIRNDASLDTINTINEQNKEAGDVGENTRLDYRSCVARGMRFDFEHSRCFGDR